jgi:hypothetical protein
MAVYIFQCKICRDEIEEAYPIGTARSMRRCACGGQMVKVLGRGMAIHSDALPNKLHGVHASNVREREWDKSMPAYKRMRDRGLQPPSIESATALENEVGDQTDINHRDIIPRDTKQRESMRRRIGETQEAIASHPGIVP